MQSTVLHCAQSSQQSRVYANLEQQVKSSRAAFREMEAAQDKKVIRVLINNEFSMEVHTKNSFSPLSCARVERLKLRMDNICLQH